MPQDSMVQLTLFTQAVEALGGQRTTARTLGIDETALRGRLSGAEPLDTGILRDIARALIDHADRCRKIERKLSPAFSENLTAIQAEGFGGS
jgi:DNA-binding transcriptional regulator YdaS (Cro superfamily)